MNRITKIYAWTVSALGLSAGVWSCVLFFKDAGGHPAAETIFLVGFILLCRCFPLKISDDYSIELSFISIVTIIMLRGPFAAAAMYLMTAPFVIEPAAGGGVESIFSRDIVQTCFNNANLIITILASGHVYELLGGRAAGLSLPECLLPLVGLVTASVLTNSLIMSLLCRFINGTKIIKTLVSGFAQFLPSILCAMPLGYFIALLLEKNSTYMAVLFILPLMLARYEFKLYIESKQLSYDIIETLTSAIEVKDHYTEGHSKRVAKISEQIARELRLSSKRVHTIKIAALLHDIGKIGIDERILNKPSGLTESEMSLVREHPEKSVQVIKNISNYGDIQSIILAHHERYDGTGYPNHLKKNDISLDAAIVSVADAFDAMTSDRPYRKGFSVAKAVDIIEEESGRQFDPRAARAIVELFDSGRLDAKPC